MYASVEQFLAQHYTAICDLMAEATARAGGHYADMSAAALRLNAEHDTVELIQALTEGRVDRQATRVNGARPTHSGLVADDLLRLTIIFQPWFEDYVTHALRDQPYLAEALRHRMQQVNTSFRANLLSVKIDHAIHQVSTLPPSEDRP
jgi:hypothetical protein